VTPVPAGESLRAAAFDLAPEPAIVVGEGGQVVAANEAAERLFGQSLGVMTRSGLAAAAAPDSPLLALVARAQAEGGPGRERGFEVSLFGQSAFRADGSAAPLEDGSVLLTLTVRSGALSGERGGAESAGLKTIIGLGRMLAHEIKNPLAGIRGAAQLLKSGARVEDTPLAQLIVDEVDRVKRLVDRMEAFSDDAAPTCRPINIHLVLDRVRTLAVNGVGEGLAVVEDYDPSLPLTPGDEDQLIQIFLNLVKNAAEAAHRRGDGQGEIIIRTAFRHGVRIRTGGARGLRSTPLEVRVIDNGPGVPAHLRDSLFQPFVTGRNGGVGLGLALVSKLVSAHGGLIDFESEPGRTAFRVLLPIVTEEPA
jgi:two-component system nitrogen regulation sensor histidine kinase GlnL